METEGLLKVTVSHVHCKCSNISEMVQDRGVVSSYMQLIGSDMWPIKLCHF